MAESMHFKAFDTFDISAVEAGTKWNEYVKAYKRLASFAGITDDKRLIDGLLHFSGEGIVDIYMTMEVNTEMVDSEVTNEQDSTQFVQMPKPDKFEDVCRKLAEHFNPENSRINEVNIFRLIKQKGVQSFEFKP